MIEAILYGILHILAVISQKEHNVLFFHLHLMVSLCLMLKINIIPVHGSGNNTVTPHFNQMPF